LFDPRNPGEFERVVAASRAIIEHCIAMGGALTGEHGVGMEKNELMPLMFTPKDLALMARVRDAFNPDGLLNPQKMLPLGKSCGELRVLPQSVGSALPA
jgi:glycolate oxidase